MSQDLSSNNRAAAVALSATLLAVFSLQFVSVWVMEQAGRGGGHAAADIAPGRQTAGSVGAPSWGRWSREDTGEALPETMPAGTPVAAAPGGEERRGDAAPARQASSEDSPAGLPPVMLPVAVSAHSLGQRPAQTQAAPGVIAASQADGASSSPDGERPTEGSQTAAPAAMDDEAVVARQAAAGDEDPASTPPAPPVVRAVPETGAAGEAPAPEPWAPAASQATPESTVAADGPGPAAADEGERTGEGAGEPAIAAREAPPAVPTAAAEEPAPVARRGRLQDEQWVLARNPRHFTLQIQSGVYLSGLRRAAQDRRLPDPRAYYRTVRGGKAWYGLLVGDFPDRASAQAAAATLGQRIRGLKPWVRAFADVHQQVR